ncbi:hypothetical protein [Myxococcus sp. AS-1-15]|uniref:hypothetical protein n=1 Tax=Myxococcus sp. AS-1-15 TaxID=2874600 RepID=UPI001CBCBF80|nr:hypothetical protein [Myxococcus sp. AS-1-15]MBZ4398072.1 hypothetical protein [Myxococcus sp. AS-1-15]
MALLTTSSALAQRTVTYNSSSGLSTGICNVFNLSTPAKVNDIIHYPVSGGARFNGSAVILEAQAGNTSASNLGTAYALKVGFKAGRKYTLAVTASKISDDPVSSPHLIFSVRTSLPAPNETQPTSCGPVGADRWSMLLDDVVGAAYISSATASNYPLTEWTASEDLDYLFVLATQGSSTKSTQVLINKISITETIPPVFSLTPASIALACGDTSARTFTVNNLGGIPNVTAYEWDLGSASNGWLHQGGPAPATLTTSEPSLTLTPNCGAAQSGIAVSVKAGSTTHGPYRSSVANSGYPTMAITGPDILCAATPQEYRVTGLPCGASVVWNSSNPTLATATTHGNNTGTLARGPQIGDVDLTATISGACGTTTLTKRVRSGPYSLTRPYGTLTFETNAGSYRTVELVTGTDFYGWTYGTNGLLLRASVTSPGIGGYWLLGEPTGSSAEVLSFETTDVGRTAIVRFNPFAPGDKVVHMTFYTTANGCSSGGANSHWLFYRGSSGLAPTGASTPR